MRVTNNIGGNKSSSASKQKLNSANQGETKMDAMPEKKESVSSEPPEISGEEMVSKGLWEVDTILYHIPTTSNGNANSNSSAKFRYGRLYKSKENSECVCFTAEDGTSYRPGDCVYVDSQRPDQPFFISAIHCFKMTKKEQLNVQVKWYYRPCEIPESVYHTLVQDRYTEHSIASDSTVKLSKTDRRTLEVQQRELFISDAIDTYAVSSLRGKCVIRHFKDIVTARAQAGSFAPDDFFYILGYNPENNRLASIQGEIRIGPCHQAKLPEFKPGQYETATERVWETTTWVPGRIADTDLMMFLRAARSMAAFAGMCDGGSTDDGCAAASRDDTTINALKALHDNDYDTGKALQELVKNPVPPSVEKRWADDERKKFVRGIKQHGKNFFKIQKELLSTKETSEIIEYYYLWKKTTAANNARPRQRARRPQTVILRRIKPGSKTNGRPASTEFLDLSSASENECDSEDSDFKDLTGYACHHCYSTASKDWHHAGKDRALLCTDCRIHFKKYGVLRPVDRPKTPPSFLFKPVKDELTNLDGSASGIRTRRAKDVSISSGGKGGRSLTSPPMTDGEKARKSPSAASTSSTTSSSSASTRDRDLKQEQDLLLDSSDNNRNGSAAGRKAKGGRRGRKRKLEASIGGDMLAENGLISPPVKLEKPSPRKRGRGKQSSGSEESESNGGNEGDTEMPDHSSPSIPSSPNEMTDLLSRGSRDRRSPTSTLETAIALMNTEFMKSESVGTEDLPSGVSCSSSLVVKTEVKSEPQPPSPKFPSASLKPSLLASVVKKESTSSMHGSSHHHHHHHHSHQQQRSSTKAEQNASSIYNFDDQENVALPGGSFAQSKAALSQYNKRLAELGKSATLTGDDLLRNVESLKSNTGIPEQSGNISANNLATPLRLIAPSAVPGSAVTLASPGSTGPVAGMSPSSSVKSAQLLQQQQPPPPIAQALPATPNATSVIRQAVKQEPLYQQPECITMDSDGEDHLHHQPGPSAKEPEPKIDDTECHRGQNSIFRRHWYRGEHNSCARTDLCFMPIPDSLLARRREDKIRQRHLQQHAEAAAKEEQRIRQERLEARPAASAVPTLPRAPGQFSVSGAVAAASALPPPAAAHSAGGWPPQHPLASLYGGGQVPPNLAAVAAANEQASAMQRLREMSSASALAGNQHAAALMDSAYRSQLEEKERYEREMHQREQEERLKRDFELSKSATNAANNPFAAGLAAATGGMFPPGADPRHMFELQQLQQRLLSGLGAAGNVGAGGHPGFPFGGGGMDMFGFPSAPNAGAVDNAALDRLTAQRLQLERFVSLDPVTAARLQIEQLNAAAAAQQHHTHSHTHTHLHIHPGQESQQPGGAKGKLTPPRPPPPTSHRAAVAGGGGPAANAILPPTYRGSPSTLAAAGLSAPGSESLFAAAQAAAAHQQAAQQGHHRPSSVMPPQQTPTSAAGGFSAANAAAMFQGGFAEMAAAANAYDARNAMLAAAASGFPVGAFGPSAAALHAAATGMDPLMQERLQQLQRQQLEQQMMMIDQRDRYAMQLQQAHAAQTHQAELMMRRFYEEQHSRMANAANNQSMMKPN